MQREKVGSEISVQQLKQRELAAQYREVEENTEVLTHIVRYNPKARKTKLSGLIDLRALSCLIVQMSYLLYTCLLRKVNIMIGTEIYAKPQRKGEPTSLLEPYYEYLLEIELQRASAEEQAAMNKLFKLVDIHRAPYSYATYLCKFIIFIRNKVVAPQADRSKGIASEAAICRQIQGLVAIVQGFLYPQVQRLSPKAMIMALEESQLFREHSLLLKCLNNSLYAAIRFSPRCKDIFAELVELENGLLAQSKRDQQENAKRIEVSIEESIRLLLKYNVVFSEQSLNENSKKDSQPTTNSSKPYIMGDVDGAGETKKYFIKLFVRERPLRKFTSERLQAIMGRLGGAMIQEIIEEEKEKEKANRGEYLVQYWASKNLLCVKYVTSIDLNVQNTDVLMFHCNYLTYSWNNITLEFIEKTSGKSKRKERFLAFKAISYVHFQEKVLFKILTMLDLLMVYAKIAEPHLRKNIFSMDEYYAKTAELNSHCEHIKHAFIRKIEKNYQGLQEALNKS